MHADRFSLLTADSPGALAVFRLRGPGVRKLLEARFSRRVVTGRAVHGEWRDATGTDVIDDPVVALISDDEAEVSIHGGPEVRRRVRASLEAGGFVAEVAGADATERLIPLCRTEIALRTVLAQRESGLPEVPERWRAGLRRLLHPARVAIVGPANVGKSTLINRLSGREVAIVADVAGTTRDYVEADAELDGGVPVVLVDTPGVRETPDAVEAAAIALARETIASAEVRVVVVDAVEPDWSWRERWPDAVVVANRCDLPHATLPEGVLAVSAQTGSGLTELAHAIRGRLGVAPEPWVWRYLIEDLER